MLSPKLRKIVADKLSNTVGHGAHYQKKVQPWDLIDAFKLNYHEGAAVKYIARNHEKNGNEDIIKAMRELERELTNRGYKVRLLIEVK